MKAVLSTVPPPDVCKSVVACCRVPSVILRVTSTTRFFSVRLITVAIQSPDQVCKHARPGPTDRLTFSRKARVILPGYAFQPSVLTNKAHMACERARTCDRKRSARERSREGLTTPASHKRVETIMAK